MRGRSGKPVEQVTLDALRAGELVLDDVRIHPDTLLAQADVALAYGNEQLAANLRRAAELALLSDDRVMAIYEALRPGRSNASELADTTGELEAFGAPLTAALVREAAEVYAARGLLR